MNYGKRNKSAFRTFLKWCTGIVLAVVFTVTTGIYNLHLITSPETAVETLGRIMENSLPAGALGNIEQVRERVMREGSLTVEPVEGISVKLDRDKVKDLPAGELKGYLFKQAAGPLYSKGVDGYLVDVRDGAVKKTLGSIGGGLYCLADDFHKITRLVLIVAGVVSIALFFALFLLSRRFGKLVSAGVVTLFAGAVGFGAVALIGGLSMATRFLPSFAGTAAQALAPLVGMVRHNYLLLLAAGGGLLVAAFFGKWIYNVATGKSEGED